jgi:hypothetical protein
LTHSALILRIVKGGRDGDLPRTTERTASSRLASLLLHDELLVS